ncbi:Ig-like domain-containing protein [Sporosarcina sp. FSL K6-5500]|uniref:Ig-like domain-containing protein n=1 Tax=Sporosarcina sp. FSL K6-5500 TaxID=2921558 RepID=UPI0030F5968D
MKTSPTNVTSASGGTKQFIATVTGTSNTAVTWTSSDLAIATINSSGLATVLADVIAGEVTTITASSVEDPAKKGTSTLTIV